MTGQKFNRNDNSRCGKLYSFKVRPICNALNCTECFTIDRENRLGCLKNTKSLKSKAPQGFSGCLDISREPNFEKEN